MRTAYNTSISHHQKVINFAKNNPKGQYLFSKEAAISLLTEISANDRTAYRRNLAQKALAQNTPELYFKRYYVHGIRIVIKQ